MSIYRFADNSPIESITTERTGGGGIRAYIVARENANPATLTSVKNTLTTHAMPWLPTQEDGKPALEVRGFGKNETTLLRLLKAQGAITDSYQQHPSISDKVSLTHKLKKNTLKASGLFYFIGDLGFLTYGYREAYDKSGKLTAPQRLMAGIFYALGTPAMILFGRGDKSDFQLKDMSQNALIELEKQGINVPQDAAIRAVANGHNQGWHRKTLNFFERYPAEITNALFGFAGTMMLWAGIKDYKTLKQEIVKTGKSEKNKTSIFIDIGIGISTIVAGLISVFVEEEAPNPNAPKKTGLARAWQLVSEKPLRAAGILLGISTLGHAGASVIDYNKARGTLKSPQATAEQLTIALKDKNALPGRAVFAGTNLAAEGLMAISSKGHGAGVKSDRSLDRSVYAVMADLIARTPPEKQESLLNTVSQYLSNRKHLGDEPGFIAQGIRGQLSALVKNPWMGSQESKLAAVSVTPEQTSRWRDKMLTPAAEASFTSPTM